MYIRSAYPTEIGALSNLVYTSVHTLCADDYTPSELDAWAPKKMDMKKFAASLFRCRNWVMVHERQIVGFINVEKDGYVNRLFTHPAYINRGVASALLKTAEGWAKKHGLRRMRLSASKTGCEFYKNRGYRIVDMEIVEKKGVRFENPIMEKML